MTLENPFDPLANPLLFSCDLNLYRNCPTVSAASMAPDEIPGLKLWLKAADSGYTEGQSVMTWIDSSGNGHDATAPAAAPVYRTAGLNGRPAFQFSRSSSQYLQTGAIAALDSDTISWFVVMQVEVDNAQAVVLRNRYSSGAGAGVNILWGTYHELSFRHSHARMADGIIAVVPYTYLGSPVVLATVWDSADRIRVFENGAFIALTTGAGANPAGHQFMRIGSNTSAGPALFMEGFLSEIVVYPRELSDGERQALERHLMVKYGLVL